jgi:glycosyltransferase involved in cell wall biosynthesis
MKKLSVIIPVYNEEATLEELVESVMKVDLKAI